MTKTVIALVLAVLTVDAAVVSAHTFSFRFGKKGAANGEFELPLSVVVDPQGNIWVADTFNNRIQKFSSTGAHLQNFGSRGSGDGQFNLPSGLAISDSGRLIVGDSDNHRIQEFTLMLGFIIRFGSRGSGDGQFFGGSIKVATDSANNIYTLDHHGTRIQKFAPDGRFLLKWGGSGSGNGLFVDVADIAVDGSNNVWVADRLGNTVQKFDSNGVHLQSIETFRSQGLFRPISLAFDSSDNLYVGFECRTVGKLDANGRLVTRITVNACPHGITFDAQDNLYVAGGLSDYFVEVYRADTDRDGLRGSQDLDSDNDGIPDAVEKGPVLLAAVEVAGAFGDPEPDDPDGDGIVNEFDLDSDGDGIADIIEAGGQDANGDGLVDDFADEDQNGIADQLDAEPLPVPDTDEVGIADFLDGDSDGDGATDVREAGGDDSDGDGMHDDALDSDADGLADSVESETGTPLPLPDTNGNGTPDYVDDTEVVVVEQDDDGCSVAPARMTSSSLLYLLFPIVVWVGRASIRKRVANKSTLVT